MYMRELVGSAVAHRLTSDAHFRQPMAPKPTVQIIKCQAHWGCGTMIRSANPEHVLCHKCASVRANGGG